MKFVILQLSLCMLLFSGTTMSMQLDGQHRPASIKPQKILIVYLSRTNNTKILAEIIYKYVGGDLVALELEKPYPDQYKAIVDQVADENETGFLPVLKTKIEHIESYDVVFIGFPTWGMQLPPPLKSFLKAYDLTGKRIIPFNSHAGYGVGSSFETVKQLAPHSFVLEGYTTKGGKEKDGILLAIQGERKRAVELEMNKWLKKLKVIQ